MTSKIKTQKTGVDSHRLLRAGKGWALNRLGGEGSSSVKSKLRVQPSLYEKAELSNDSADFAV